MKAEFFVTGLVQGVGFRPFIFNLARRHQLSGQVKNTADGVFIEVFGNKITLQQFAGEISHLKPPAAEIHAIECNYTATTSETSQKFSIKESKLSDSGCALLPPDMDVCQTCRDELFNKRNRRYLYPFINCTDCGPRYSIINRLPYDRPFTSMAEFNLCSKCKKEYCDPKDRRFHAQPNACPDCGPDLTLLDAHGKITENIQPISKAQALLRQGKIIAVKGVGGFHLAVDAANNLAVQRLRNRKGRPHKPLAIMAQDIVAIHSFAKLSAQEEKTINSHQKPIIILNKKAPFSLAHQLSLDCDTIGVMLPYTPLHHLLFYDEREPPLKALVMTSGNLAGEPMAITTSAAIQHLNGIADYFLTHNRKIINVSDDSVLRVNHRDIKMIRRSRSYAPVPISINAEGSQLLAVGAALKNTVCLSKGHNLFVSQHIGDLTNLESQCHFNSVINHLQELLHIKPQQVIHDLHPDYPSTIYAKSLALPSLAVQHHHAHAAGCMAENNIQGKAIAIILDGTGLGTDQTIWGGEILVADYQKFIRAGHLSSLAQPGGDMAVKEPWRMAVSYLYAAFGQKIFAQNHPLLTKRAEKIPVIIQMIDKQINSPQTSSCGRVFDCVAALLGLWEEITFEGQAAIALEAIAATRKEKAYPYKIHKNIGSWQIDLKESIRAIMADLAGDIFHPIISAKFHTTIIAAFSEACQKIAHHHKINEVVLSGGVFQNMIILKGMTDSLVEMGFKVFTNKEIPANDGGIAFGQAVIGAHSWNG